MLKFKNSKWVEGCVPQFVQKRDYSLDVENGLNFLIGIIMLRILEM
jgi:hypothetical protein